MAKKLPIGISDFKKVIEDGYAYVDKSLLIEELIEKGTEVALIPRLRRFGKTLNLSMLRYFFEKGSEDTSYLLDRAPSYGTPCRLRIPNIEVGELYKSMILDWFNQSIHKHKYQMLLNSLISGDIDTFSQLFQEFMFWSVSVFDVPAVDSEKIYHGFILGMLIGLSDRYEVKSNRESGLGRYDVMLIPKNPNDLGIVMEFKKVGRFEKTTLEAAVESALKQIEDRHYAQELIDRGIKRILFLGFAFEGKEVLIRSKFKVEPI